MSGRSSESEIQNLLHLALACQETQEKCKKLSKVIECCGTHFLGDIFSGIVDDIFIKNKWPLTRIGLSSGDFTCIKNFLTYGGPIFRLIERMQHSGVQTKCPLPLSSVPNLIKSECLASDTYSYRMGSAFESFFSHFSSFITKPQQNKISEQSPNRFLSSSPGMDDCIYFLLLDDYLSHFLPTDGDGVPPTITIAKQGTSFKVQPKSQFNMSKSSLLLRHNSGRHCSPGQGTYNETWCCEMLVQIFCAFWLDEYQSCYDQNESGAPIMRTVPIENHVRAVRLLVKHVHSFCNSYSEHSLVKRFQNDSLVEQINHGLMSILQPSLYNFLNYCFDVWPLDVNFRIVLETWLSFIQPWRYGKGNHTSSEISQRQESSVSNSWYHFVYCNIQFYTRLFQLAIKRFIRVDISSGQNAILLFRVAKIYSQPNLVTLIDQAEETTFSPSFQTSGNYDSYVQPLRGMSFEKCEELSIFSSTFTNVVKQLLVVITQALDTLKSSSSSTTFDFDWSHQALRALGYGALDRHDTKQLSTSIDRKKIAQNLQFARDTFARIYDLPLPTVDKLKSRSNFGMDTSIADHKINAEGKMVLSPTGRLQLQNNLKKFPVLPKSPSGPICSYESAFLVRTLHAFTSGFNARYGRQIEKICKKNDFVGKIACTLFNVFDPDRSEIMEPHLNLRFLAHYRTLFYIGLLYIGSILFKFSFVMACLYLFVFFAIFVVVKALIN